MYNKLFNKIVDSSIWMEPDHVRLIWMMFIAIMDEDGFVNLAGVKNVAHRAVMDLEKAQIAIDVLESPDKESSNPANEGRRLTRVPGGWMVNNSKEYRDIVKREHQKELNRERVKRHRKNKSVMECNGSVMDANETVTPSEAETEAKTETETEAETKVSRAGKMETILEAWNASGSTSKVRKLTKDRKAKLTQRLHDCDWPWEDAISKLPIPNTDRFSWQPDFDWLIANDRNAYSLAEGKFDKSGKSTSRPGVDYDPNHDYASEIF